MHSRLCPNVFLMDVFLAPHPDRVYHALVFTPAIVELAVFMACMKHHALYLNTHTHHSLSQWSPCVMNCIRCISMTSHDVSQHIAYFTVYNTALRVIK